MYQLFKSRIFLKQFMAILLVGVFIFVGIGISVYWISKNTMEEQGMFLVQQYRNQLLQDFNGRIDDIDRSIAIQAKYIQALDPRTFDSSDIQQLFLDILNEDSRIIDLLLINKEGQILNSIGGPSKTNLIDRDYVKNGLRGEATITELYKAKKSDTIIMTIAYPIFINDRPQYVLAGVISLKKMKDIIENVSFNKAGKAFLVDENGYSITKIDYTNMESYNNEFVSKKIQTLGVNEVMKGNNGVKKYSDNMGNTVIGAYTWIDKLDTGLVVEFDEKYIMKPLYDLDKHFRILQLMALISTIIVAYFIAGKIYKPIHQLIDVVHKLKKSSDVYQIQIETNDELDILIKNFNEMQLAIQKREEEIHKYATRDTLTDIFNRRAGIEILNREIHRALEDDTPISIMFADINDLKYVNDNFGHKHGDKLIKLVAEFIYNNIEKNHSIARLGGDEFLVILSKCTEEYAQEIQNKINDKIKDYNEKEIEKFSVSVSFGIAEYDKLIKPTTDMFIEIADNRMYKNKDIYKKNRKIKELL